MRITSACSRLVCMYIGLTDGRGFLSHMQLEWAYFLLFPDEYACTSGLLQVMAI